MKKSYDPVDKDILFDKILITVGVLSIFLVVFSVATIQTKQRDTYSDMYKINAFASNLETISYIDNEKVIYTNVPFNWQFDDTVDEPLFYRKDSFLWYQYGKEKAFLNVKFSEQTETEYFVKISNEYYDKLVHRNDISVTNSE